MPRKAKTNNSTGPFECITEGCQRRSRSIRKPGRCNTCYSRASTGAAPKFPADPLVEYMDARGVGWPREGTRPKPGSKISLERLDAICIDVLEVHPMQVYGDLYFQECVS